MLLHCLGSKFIISLGYTSTRTTKIKPIEDELIIQKYRGGTTHKSKSREGQIPKALPAPWREHPCRDVSEGQRLLLTRSPDKGTIPGVGQLPAQKTDSTVALKALLLKNKKRGQCSGCYNLRQKVWISTEENLSLRKHNLYTFMKPANPGKLCRLQSIRDCALTGGKSPFVLPSGHCLQASHTLH